MMATASNSIPVAARSTHHCVADVALSCAWVTGPCPSRCSLLAGKRGRGGLATRPPQVEERQDQADDQIQEGGSGHEILPREVAGGDRQRDPRMPGDRKSVV